jgi:hypothetical protein
MTLKLTKSGNWYYPACDLSRLIVCEIAKRSSLKQREVEELIEKGCSVERIEDGK